MGSITTIVLLLLATLTLVVVGIAVLVAEADHRRSLAYSVAPDQGSPFRRLRHDLERRLMRTRRGRALRRSLDSAAITLPVADYVLIVVVAGLALAYFSYDLGGPIVMTAVVVGSSFGLRSWFRGREAKRQAKFIAQLPELSRLLANAASAGLSLRAGLLVAAQEMEAPTSTELDRVNEELSVGAPLEEALERLEKRLPSKELAVLVNTLIIQNRSGGRVVTALQGITEALDVRRDLRREVATLTAGSKATVIAVAAMGGMMVLLVNTSVPGGLRAVMSSPAGVAVVAVSASMFAFGLWLARRVGRVEV